MESGRRRMRWSHATEKEELSGGVEEIPTSEKLEAAYARCLELAARHYENFPVASRLIPRALRGPVAAIYAFARRADDFADEPEFSGRRLELLREWEGGLRSPESGVGRQPIFVALHDTIRRHRLPAEPFLDLLSAFRQDATRDRYHHWDEVLDYCRRSANPVGRLVLLLFGHREPSLYPLSDSICTALQLTNFWQDLAVDARRGRLYLPGTELKKYRVPEEAILNGRAPALPGYLPLMEELGRRTLALFEAGRSLPARVGGRLGFELRLTWLGGRKILEETRRHGFNVFHSRPALSKFSWARLLVEAGLEQLRVRG